MAALWLPSLPSRCVRWITRGGAAHASRVTSRESGLVSSGVRSCDSRDARHLPISASSINRKQQPKTAGSRPIPRGAPCARDSRTGHEGGQRRRASPSRAPHCACARAHAATHAGGAGAGGGGSRVVSGVAGCARARGGGGQRARSARASRQSLVRWYSEARRFAHAREHPTAMYVRSLAPAALALVGWVVRDRGGQRAGGAGGLPHAPLRGGAVGRCAAPRDRPARGLASLLPSCLVPPLLLGPFVIRDHPQWISSQTHWPFAVAELASHVHSRHGLSPAALDRVAWALNGGAVPRPLPKRRRGRGTSRADCRRPSH